MSDRMVIHMALASRSESICEVNVGSIEKDPSDRVEGTVEGVMESICDVIHDLDTTEALVIWVKPER